MTNKIKRVMFSAYFICTCSLSFAQLFQLRDSVITEISYLDYRCIPVQNYADDYFTVLYCDGRNVKGYQWGTKDNACHFWNVKLHTKTDGIKSGAIKGDTLALWDVDNRIFICIKKKDVFKQVKKFAINAPFREIAFLSDTKICLMNNYNYYTASRLYDFYYICILNNMIGKGRSVPSEREFDLGKGILHGHYSRNTNMEAQNNRIAMAHPTLPYIYIIDTAINIVDTIVASFVHPRMAEDSLNAVFTDSIMEKWKIYAKNKMDLLETKGLDKMERIEKVFWVNDDTLAYTVRQFNSDDVMLLFYDVAHKEEIYKYLLSYSYEDDKGDKGYRKQHTPSSLASSGRILFKNNKIISCVFDVSKDEENMYHVIYIYDMLPFAGAK